MVVMVFKNEKGMAESREWQNDLYGPIYNKKELTTTKTNENSLKSHFVVSHSLFGSRKYSTMKLKRL